MNRWFRVEAAIRNDPEISQLAERLGISTVEAIGHCTLVWAAIAEQRPSGNLERVSDQMLEHWAEFRPGGKRKRGAFAQVYRDLFIAGDAAIGWTKTQGKLVEFLEKDRKRKARKAAEAAARNRGDGTNEGASPEEVRRAWKYAESRLSGGISITMQLFFTGMVFVPVGSMCQS